MMWGDDTRWAGWCHPDADRAWRLFLPLEGADGVAHPWPVPTDDLDSRLWWPDLAEYPGAGGDTLDLEPAGGMVEPATLEPLVAALTAVTGSRTPWRHLVDEPGPPPTAVAPSAPHRIYCT